MSGRPPADALAKPFEIQKGIAQLFEFAMRDGCTPPLAALESLARALGCLYSDVARVHLDPGGCPCGWKPAEGDVAALGEAMRSAARPEPPALPNLQTMEPVGRA